MSYLAHIYVHLFILSLQGRIQAVYLVYSMILDLEVEFRNKTYTIQMDVMGPIEIIMQNE